MTAAPTGGNMSVSTRTSGIAPPCRAFRLRNALWLFGSLSNRERTDDLMRRPLLQPDRQSEVRAARAVRTDDHIGEFTGGVAETTHAANYRHRARIWVRPVGNQPRAVIEKMKPAGEKGRTLAGTNLRQSGRHRSAFDPVADTAGIIWIVRLHSVWQRSRREYLPIGDESIAPAELLEGNSTIETKRTTIDSDILPLPQFASRIGTKRRGRCLPYT